MMKVNKIFFTDILIILSSVICCKKNDTGLPDIDNGGVRLKHFTTAQQVHEAVTELMYDYELAGEGSFTDIGYYPQLPYIYYYTVNYNRDINSEVTAYRTLSADVGMGDETKQEILEMFPDYMEVADSRLGKAPFENVFAIRYRNNTKRDWRYELYLSLDHINQDNQVITLTGGFGPTNSERHEAIAPEPPDEKVVISALLKLTEPIGE